jgi:hypothetical protein
MAPLLETAQKQRLDQDHLYILQHDNLAANLHYKWKAFQKNPTGRTFRSIFLHVVRARYLGAAMVKFIQMLIELWAVPRLIAQTVAYLSGQPKWIDNGYLLAALLGLCQAVVTLCRTMERSLYVETIHKTRVMMMIAVYEASFTKRELTSGTVFNLVNNDINNITLTLPDWNALWAIPMQMILSCIFLYELLEDITWIALGAALLSIVLTLFSGIFLTTYFAKAFEVNDDRISVLREALYGM